MNIIYVNILGERVRRIWKQAGCLLAAATILSACGGSTSDTSAADQTPSAQAEVVHVDGFPLDRRLPAMASWNQLDVVVRLRDLEFLPPRWTTADGEAPAYVREGRAPTEEEGREAHAVVTPVKGVIAEPLWGHVVDGADLTFLVGGGAVDDVTFEVSSEVTPQLAAMRAADSVVIAGRVMDSIVGKTVDVAFAYAVDGDQARTLMSSAVGGEDVRFQMGELRDALRGRSCSPVVKNRKPERRLNDSAPPVSYGGC